MPLYDYECDECGHRFEAVAKVDNRHSQKCVKCGKSARMVPCFKTELFKPFWHEDFGDEPVYIESKRQYKELCKKHGVYAPYVFGKGWNLEEV